MTLSQSTLAEELGEIEERAHAINLSLAPLAARAGVRVSQISQWRSGAAQLTGATAGKHFRALWRALEEEERKLREYLCGKRAGRAHDGNRAQAPRAGAPAGRARGSPARAAG
jgi:transcriptional regulator with XRE-family HTH domain